MPEQPPGKRHHRPLLPSTASIPVKKERYAELHCRSNFSFLSAASHPDELVARANELGYAALAITDQNSVAGVVRAHVAAKDVGLKLLIGAEITPVDAPPILLWSMNRTGYGRLCRLITRGRRKAPKGECELKLSDVLEHSEGLLAGLVLRESGASLAKTAGQLREAFGDRAYLVAELHRGGNDLRQLHDWISASQQVGIPLVAANDVQYHVRERQPLHDVLAAIKHGCSVEELGYRRWPNAERHLKTAAEMSSMFAICPDAMARTIEIADRCHFTLDELRYDYPDELCPPGQTQMERLTALTWDGAKWRYPNGVPDKVNKLLNSELALIEELNYAAYFLTVWDLVRFARDQEILCQGRGSAANSAVCYCLGVTPVDPGKMEVLFERFISRERKEAPDIDVDFEHSRREEVIQYLYQKYGRERSGMTATVICYRPRSAIRDVGKALGLSLDRIDALAKHIDHYQDPKDLAVRMREAGLPPESRLGKQLIALVTELLGFPRHLSQHVGGVVLTNSPLCELVPIENASMPGRTVIEFDKDDLDVLGILKVDVLALGMLTAIRRAFELVKQHHHQQLTIASISLLEDEAVFGMIGRADTIGVFQVESRAQMSMLPRMQPKTFYDLVIEVSLVRPGPIQGDMVNPYLRRRCGEEEITYPDDRIKAVLERTKGVPIFQEQAMQLVVVAAGFSPGEADQLRRAMGTWRKQGLIEGFHQKLVDGMQNNGYTTEFAERLFKQISGFGEYGFPESHACSFAILVWVSAWLKHHFPAAFAAALINSQPMGFYAPAQLATDARNHKVPVLPIDINRSDWDCTLESCSSADAALRLGFRLLKGISQTEANAIVAARGSRPFTSMDDFFHRTRTSSAVAARLSRGDVFRSLQLNRRESLWQSLPDPDPGPLFDGRQDQEPNAPLPQMTNVQETFADYQSSGMSLRDHPISFIRADLDECGVLMAKNLKDESLKDRRCRVAGLVLIRQRPSTAKGITFMTIEDETGTANLVVHVNTWERFRTIARQATAIVAHGILQHQHGTIHLVVDRLEDLTPLLGEVGNKSRDFR